MCPKYPWKPLTEYHGSNLPILLTLFWVGLAGDKRSPAVSRGALVGDKLVSHFPGPCFWRLMPFARTLSKMPRQAWSLFG